MRNLFLLIALCIFTAQLHSQAIISPSLTQQMSNNNGQPIEVIVTFNGNTAPTLVDVAALTSAGITSGLTMNSLPIAGILATPTQINTLAANPNVKSLYYNEPLQYENHNATELTGVKKARTDADFIFNNGGMPLSGKGIGLVVNDSGVDGTHPDMKLGQNLVENVMASTNLNAISGILPYTPVAGVPNTDATGGHGTHVAGIAGGTGAASQGLYEGVAPGADLIGYGSGAGLFILDVVSAFDWSITHQFQFNIRIITNSWGTTSDVGTAFDPNNPINIATKKCYDRNIVVVFSAGNSGSASGTITGNYKKAPWVICVAAGDKQGRLTDFSSRGRENVGGTVTVGNETFTWEDRPTVTSPGKDIISARTVSPIGMLSTTTDIELIEPAYLAYYTTLDGTSMAAPHVAGIVALLLEANPQLTPMQVKNILQQTATNIPGMKSWEVGAGYVNAYAAIDAAYGNSGYGQTLNMTRTFNSGVNESLSTQNFSISYSPGGTANSMTFNVSSGTGSLEVVAEVDGVLGNTGNLINLVLFSPSGQRYSAGIPVAFTLYTDRGVAVTNPEPGTWTLSIEGLQGVAVPETVEGTIKFRTFNGFTNMADISGNPAEEAIQLAISTRLMDGKATGFAPNDNLTRLELADYLIMGQGVRQAFNASLNYNDVSAADSYIVEAVMSQGAALRDANLTQNALLVDAPAAGFFAPNGTVTRAEVAYSIVQALGLQAYAQSLQGQNMTVTLPDGTEVDIDDQTSIPANLRGHVQAAINLNLINVFFSVTQDPFSFTPVIHANFQPSNIVKRDEFAVIITRTFDQFQNPTPGLKRGSASPIVSEFKVFPNPTTDIVNMKMGMLETTTEGTIQLIGSNGQVIRQLNQTLTPHTTVQMNVTNLPAGMYYLQIVTDSEEQFTERILINR